MVAQSIPLLMSNWIVANLAESSKPVAVRGDERWLTYFRVVAFLAVATVSSYSCAVRRPWAGFRASTSRRRPTNRQG